MTTSSQLPKASFGCLAFGVLSAWLAIAAMVWGMSCIERSRRANEADRLAREADRLKAEEDADVDGELKKESLNLGYAAAGFAKRNGGGKPDEDALEVIATDAANRFKVPIAKREIFKQQFKRGFSTGWRFQ